MPEFNERELALISLCLQFGLSNIDDLEEVADEDIREELELLKAKIE